MQAFHTARDCPRHLFDSHRTHYTPRTVNHTTLRIALAASALTLVQCRNRSTESTPPPATRTEAPSPAALDARAAGLGDSGPAGASDLEPPAPAAEFREAARFLPQGHVGDWVQSGSVTRSNAANLFQIIDGAAAAYQSYGIRNFAKTDYRKPGTTLVATIEVYEFANPLGAFGRYSLMLSDGRDPGSLQPQSINEGRGYQGTTQLVFWKGSVLVTISISDTSDDANEQAIATAAHLALPQLAAAVDPLVTGQIAPPLSPLPSDGLVWGGATYIADSVFGVDQTGAAWVGHYSTADRKRYRLAIFRRASVAEAQGVLAKFRALGAHAITGLGDEAFSVTSPQSGEIVLARSGNNVFAVANSSAPNQPAPTRDAKIAIVRTSLALPMPNLPPDGVTPR
jgi:hypothetical protein